MIITRNRTPSKYVYYGLCSVKKKLYLEDALFLLCLSEIKRLQNMYYGLYLYFSGLSLRRTSERLSCYIQRNHVSVWNWIQRYKPQRIFIRSKKISEYIVDETLLKVGPEYIWLWIAIEPENKQILALF